MGTCKIESTLDLFRAVFVLCMNAYVNEMSALSSRFEDRVDQEIKVKMYTCFEISLYGKSRSRDKHVEGN